MSLAADLSFAFWLFRLLHVVFHHAKLHFLQLQLLNKRLRCLRSPSSLLLTIFDRPCSLSTASALALVLLRSITFADVPIAVGVSIVNLLQIILGSRNDWTVITFTLGVFNLTCIHVVVWVLLRNTGDRIEPVALEVGVLLRVAACASVTGPVDTLLSTGCLVYLVRFQLD